jgi:DNA-binding CsgD family transcriptional regulator
MLFDHMDAAVRLASTPFDPRSTKALLLLDPKCNVIAVSECAARLILLGDGLDVRGGRLTVSRPDDQRVLDAGIGRAADVLATGARPCAVRINRPSGARPWLAIVRPEFRNFPGFDGIAGGVSVELRAGAPPALSAALLQSVFCLTEREAEVVRLLYLGHSIASLAHSMEISPNTARVHLHAAFAKTSTTRQSELLQLCSRLAEI